jgi:hypothetical protein
MQSEAASPDSSRDLESNEALTRPAKRKSLINFDVFGIARFLEFKNYPELSAQELHCCFVCLETAEGNCAIKVPCIRPTEIRGVLKEVNGGEGGVKCDSAVFSRMRKEVYRKLGWRRWLPYYGILDAYEVEVDHLNQLAYGIMQLTVIQFQIDGCTTLNNRTYTIHNVNGVDIKRREKELDSMIKHELSALDLEFGDPCYDGWHAKTCPLMQFGSPCLQDMATQAREQKEALAYLHMFKLCLINPWRANRYKLLEGIAQDKSLIYNTKSV